MEPFAAQLNSAGIKTETWTGFNPNLSIEANLANNQTWITGRVKNGASVINIGLDPGVNYAMENQVVNSTQWVGTGTVSKKTP